MEVGDLFEMEDGWWRVIEVIEDHFGGRYRIEPVAEGMFTPMSGTVQPLALSRETKRYPASDFPERAKR